MARRRVAGRRSARRRSRVIARRGSAGNMMITGRRSAWAVMIARRGSAWVVMITRRRRARAVVIARRGSAGNMMITRRRSAWVVMITRRRRARLAILMTVITIIVAMITTTEAEAASARRYALFQLINTEILHRRVLSKKGGCARERRAILVPSFSSQLKLTIFPILSSFSLPSRPDSTPDSVFFARFLGS